MKTRTTGIRTLQHLQIAEFGYEDNGENAKWERGRRNLYIIHYILDGEGYFNGKLLKKNEGFLIRPMAESKYYPDPNNPWNYFWISFYGSAADEICKKHIATNDNDVFKYDFRGMLTDFIGTLFSEESALSETKAISYFYRLISEHKTNQETGKNHYVDEAKNYVNLNFHRPITVKNLAELQKISDRYLYNLFIKFEGISPKQYIINTRIQNAKLLLAQSDCSITDVAASVGFSDVLVFSSFFKKHTGLSPKAYRGERTKNK